MPSRDSSFYPSLLFPHMTELRTGTEPYFRLNPNGFLSSILIDHQVLMTIFHLLPFFKFLPGRFCPVSRHMYPHALVMYIYYTLYIGFCCYYFFSAFFYCMPSGRHPLLKCICIAISGWLGGCCAQGWQLATSARVTSSRTYMMTPPIGVLAFLGSSWIRLPPSLTRGVFFAAVFHTALGHGSPSGLAGMSGPLNSRPWLQLPFLSPKLIDQVQRNLILPIYSHQSHATPLTWNIVLTLPLLLYWVSPMPITMSFNWLVQAYIG